ncbi:hypothetical protein J4Z15_26345, partial [Escherichia coli]
MGSCAAPSAKGDDKFITTDYLQQCHRQVAARLCENEAVELDVSGPKPRLTISPLASLDEPDSLKRL